MSPRLLDRRTLVPLLVGVSLSCLVATTVAHGQSPRTTGGPTLEQLLGEPQVGQLVAASATSRLAWAVNERGQRNVWIADGPDYQPRQLTRFDRDDGQELSQLSISGDGRYVVFVRGGDHDCNWDCTVAVNATSSPIAPSVSLWIVSTASGEGRALGEGEAPTISPTNDRVAFVRERQIWVAPLDGSAPPRRLFSARGELREPRWSPDGRRLAFVADRGDHAFVGIYDNDSTPLRWLAPTTGRDAMPRWSPDGRRVAFVRRPGLGGPPDSILAFPLLPWKIVVADASTGGGRIVWSSPNTVRGGYPRTFGARLFYGAGARVIYTSYEDGWPHLYSVPDAGGAPVLLTPGPYMVEDVALSGDGTFLVFAGNLGTSTDDIDRRHLARVSVDRADVRPLTSGTGLEFAPVVTADLATVAYLGASTQQAVWPSTVPTSAGATRRLAALPRAPGLARALVEPRVVTFRAPDGLEIRGQLFERRDGTARKPAVIFAHGGPERQMLLGWHSLPYYAATYAVNQYLASRGYVVLAVNFRLGIGYGHDFHRVLDGWSRGASEYQDIVAAHDYLRTLPQVDASRVGIYGGSYGGFLTAMALARNSDRFAVGVDIHGPSDWTNDNAQRIGGLAWDYERGDRARAADVAWQASPVAAVDGWRSPVLFIHGDDDRNTRFSHTTDLVNRLAVRGVPYEELIIPDDTHHWHRHANALQVWTATVAFLDRYLQP